MPKAWIIGGSSGLGLASANALARDGYDLTVSSRSGTKLDTAVAALGADWPERSIRALSLDLTDEADVAAALDDQVSAANLPDAIVISSGGPAATPASTLSLDALDTGYRQLLRPTVQLVTGLASQLAARGSGAIAIVTSGGVQEPIPNLALSNIFRSGITAFMKGAADELAPSGVRVLAVAPGRIETGRLTELDSGVASREGRAIEDVQAANRSSIPVGRYGTPQEFGDVVAFLVSPAASYLTGTTISVDGGKNRGLLA